MPTIILVHGAWLNASCWDAVTPSLQAAGFTVIAPDLPGHGRDTTPLAGCTLAAYADTIVRAIDAADGPVTLVGHSLGGIVISTAAERRADKVAQLVYLAAYLLGDGDTVQAQQDADSHVPPAMRPAADWSTVAIDPALMGDVFFNDVSTEVAAPWIAGSAGEPTAPFGTPVHVTDGNWGRVPRAYITTRRDHALSPALQQRFVQSLPCDPVLAVDTGHAPFVSRPAELAETIASLAAGAKQARHRIAILGAGKVGGTLGRRWAALGHTVAFGVRRPEEGAGAVKGLGDTDDPALPAGARVCSTADAVRDADIVLLATPWAAVADAISEAGGAAAFAGRIVIDATNPIAPGMRLDVGPDGASGAERVQALVPGARVVKAFNTTGWENMRRPQYDGAATMMCVAGDDPHATTIVRALAADLGFEPVDAGALVKARLLESLALLWISLAFGAGAPAQGRDIAFRLVRR